MSNERGKEAETVQPQVNVYEDLIAVDRSFLVFLICTLYAMEKVGKITREFHVNDLNYNQMSCLDRTKIKTMG